MTHEVLISYSRHDKLQADAICNRLESKGIRCWIAPRDVPVGTEYADSIVQAIEASEVLLLVYSSNADRSKQVKREVERAVSAGITIMPVRIEDAQMSNSFEYYVGSIHWLDAITPPLEKHIDTLAEQLQAMLLGGAHGREATAAGASSTSEQVGSVAAAGSQADAVSTAPRSGRSKDSATQAPMASRDTGSSTPPRRRPVLIAAGAVLGGLVALAAYHYLTSDGLVEPVGDYDDAAYDAEPAATGLLYEADTAYAKSSDGDLDRIDYESLVAACEQQPAWVWSCEVPAIPDMDPFLSGTCECIGRILRHIETGLFRCEELPPQCGGVSFQQTLGYPPDMEWYEEAG